MPVYVLFMIPKLGASPPDAKIFRNSLEVISLSDWKKHWIFFRKKGRKQVMTIQWREAYYINLCNKLRNLWQVDAANDLYPW